MKKKKTVSDKIIYGQLKKMIPSGIVLLAICFISCGLDLIVPYIDKLAVNDGLMSGNKMLFIKLLIIGFLITLIGKLVSFINTALFNKFSGTALRNIKSDVFSRLTELPMYIFSNNPDGYVHARLNETDTLSGLFSPVIFKICTSSITMIGALTYLFKLDIIVFSMTLTSIPIIFFICRNFSGKVTKLSENINESEADLSGKMQEYIQGAAEIKQLNLESKTAENVDVQLNSIVNNSVKRSNRIEGGSVYATVVCAAIQLIVILIVGTKIMDNNMSLGDYVSVAKYISFVFSPVILFSTYYLTLQQSIVAGKRIEEFFSVKETKNESGEIIPKITSIRLDNISYSYNKENNVLENISIEINAPEKINIYGRNGSGKTTLVKLIIGLISPTEGEIYVNNIPLKNINLSSLRKRIGMLSQNSFIFSGPVISNIASTPEELLIWNSICNYDIFKEIDWKTGIIIENGKNLSSGQKQKIALARLMTKNPDIIVIDEGITNLDAESRKVICDAVNTLFKDKICILISHSDDFADVADRKLLIKESRLFSYCPGE